MTVCLIIHRYKQGIPLAIITCTTQIPDFQAYDSVWRPALYKKLESVGFGGKTLDLIKSMYSNDSLRFLINGHYSEELFLTRGVKQGLYNPQKMTQLKISNFRM